MCLPNQQPQSIVTDLFKVLPSDRVSHVQLSEIVPTRTCGETIQIVVPEPASRPQSPRIGSELSSFRSNLARLTLGDCAETNLRTGGEC